MGNNQLINVTLNVTLVAPNHGFVSGTMTITDVCDAYVEALAYAFDNRLPVPIPSGARMPTYVGRVYVRHFEVRSRSIDATVFGGSTTYITGSQEATVEFYAEP